MPEILASNNSITQTVRYQSWAKTHSQALYVDHYHFNTILTTQVYFPINVGNVKENKGSSIITLAYQIQYGHLDINHGNGRLLH